MFYSKLTDGNYALLRPHSRLKLYVESEGGLDQ